MKKIVYLVLSILIAIGTLCAAIFVLDNTAPTINVISTPELGCKVDANTLLKYAEVNDDNLKSFFIEETDLLQIAENQKLTYIAIDKSNNVSRKQVDVKVDDDVSTYHIETKKSLELQINTNLVSNEYFVLKNECGWKVNDTFQVNGINNKLAGEYDVTVSSRKHVSQPLEATFVVDDFKAPKIVLDREVLHQYTHRYWNDEYFMDFIDHIEDDVDDGETLVSKVKTNWKDAMNPGDYGKIDNPGTYTVTYYVTDSEGNTGRTTLKVKLEEYVPEPETIEENTGE